MERYWQKYAPELDEQAAYDNILQSLRENEYYARGGGNSSTNSNRGGSYSSYHENPEHKLKELAKMYEKIQDFFLALGLDMKMYIEPIQPPIRRR